MFNSIQFVYGKISYTMLINLDPPTLNPAITVSDGRKFSQDINGKNLKGLETNPIDKILSVLPIQIHTLTITTQKLKTPKLFPDLSYFQNNWEETQELIKYDLLNNPPV